MVEVTVAGAGVEMMRAGVSVEVGNGAGGAGRQAARRRIPIRKAFFIGSF